MPALLRYFSDLIHFKTSNPNPIPLHGNPVLDNFVFKHAAVQTGRTFASAHSCGLRPRTMMIFCNLQIFASAHSCGLRPIPVQQTRQRVSLPQRIRAGCDEGSYGNGKSLSSLPQRIRAGCDHGFSQHTASIVTLPQRIRAGCDYIENVCNVNIRSLPQRIRAGCDDGKCVCNGIHRLCHSAFARVATPRRHHPRLYGALCHSAFARVATIYLYMSGTLYFFATAHSRGLRLRKSNAAHCEFAARR